MLAGRSVRRSATTQQIQQAGDEQAEGENDGKDQKNSFMSGPAS
jgi:hypothetical protein